MPHAVTDVIFMMLCAVFYALEAKSWQGVSGRKKRRLKKKISGAFYGIKIY